MMKKRFHAYLILVVCHFFLIHCASTGSTSDTNQFTPKGDLSIASVEIPSPLLEGTSIEIKGKGFISKEHGDIKLIFSGTFNGSPVAPIQVDAIYRSTTSIVYEMDSAFLSSIPGESGIFNGTLEVRILYEDGDQKSSHTDATFTVSTKLAPTIETLDADYLYFGDVITA